MRQRVAERLQKDMYGGNFTVEECWNCKANKIVHWSLDGGPSEAWRPHDDGICSCGKSWLSPPDPEHDEVQRLASDWFGDKPTMEETWEAMLTYALAKHAGLTVDAMRKLLPKLREEAGEEP